MKSVEVIWLDFGRTPHQALRACAQLWAWAVKARDEQGGEEEGAAGMRSHEPFSARRIMCIWGGLLGPHPIGCSEQTGPRGSGKPRPLGQERSRGRDRLCDGLWPQEGATQHGLVPALGRATSPLPCPEPQSPPALACLLSSRAYAAPQVPALRPPTLSFFCPVRVHPHLAQVPPLPISAPPVPSSGLPPPFPRAPYPAQRARTEGRGEDRASRRGADDGAPDHGVRALGPGAQRAGYSAFLAGRNSKTFPSAAFQLPPPENGFLTPTPTPSGLQCQLTNCNSASKRKRSMSKIAIHC